MHWRPWQWQPITASPWNGRPVSWNSLRALKADSRYLRQAGLADMTIHQLVLLGEWAAEIERGLLQAGGKIPAVKLASLEETRQWLSDCVRAGDCVLFKGSNSMGLSKAVTYLRENLTNKTE